MSGYTKHMFEKEFNEIRCDLTKYISELIPLLPYSYNFDTIRSLLEKYYPYEWLIINERYKYYCIKEDHIMRHGKKPRFKLKDPCRIIPELKVYKKIMNIEYVQNHQLQYSKETLEQFEHDFCFQRNPKIKKIYDKIENAKNKTQQMEPEFIDSLMGLYDRKKTTQKDKVHIIYELQKYYCSKVIWFFSKKIDTEYNSQLRYMTFIHLQSLGFQPILRKQKYMRIPSKNRNRREYLKNVYAKETYDIKAIPEELEYRIENSKDQAIKTYDFFISHSSVDYNEVQMLIQNLNENGKNIYCDWISDNDYLKRHLVGEATLNVITKRLQQSKELIFVISENSMKSDWCKYELNDFYNQKKNIYYVRKEDILNGIFKHRKYDSKWFTDPLYKNMNLFNMKL